MADGRVPTTGKRKSTKLLDYSVNSPTKSPVKKKQGLETTKIPATKKENNTEKKNDNNEMEKLKEFEERMLTKMEKLMKGALDSAVQQMLRDMEERMFTKITTLVKTEIEEALKNERKRWMKDFEKVKANVIITSNIAVNRVSEYMEKLMSKAKIRSTRP